MLFTKEDVVKEMFFKCSSAQEGIEMAALATDSSVKDAKKFFMSFPLSVIDTFSAYIYCCRLMIKYDEGMSIEELAGLTGKSREAVQWNVRIAKNIAPNEVIFKDSICFKNGAKSERTRRSSKKEAFLKKCQKAARMKKVFNVLEIADAMCIDICDALTYTRVGTIPDALLYNPLVEVSDLEAAAKSSNPTEYIQELISEKASEVQFTEFAEGFLNLVVENNNLCHERDILQDRIKRLRLEKQEIEQKLKDLRKEHRQAKKALSKAV